MPCEVPPDAQTLFYGARKLLLVLHVAAAIVLIGAATHHALQMRHLLRGRFGRIALERTYARVVAVAFGTVYLLGAILYPTYRYHVRELVLDRHYPMMSNLFDVKENMATIALPLALALGALGGRLTDGPEDKPLVPVYATMSVFVAATVWFNFASGIIIASFRSV